MAKVGNKEEKAHSEGGEKEECNDLSVVCVRKTREGKKGSESEERRKMRGGKGERKEGRRISILACVRKRKGEKREE